MMLNVKIAKQSILWTIFIFFAVIGQSYFPGTDMLFPALLVPLQRYRYREALIVGFVFMILQEGLGSAPFGIGLLIYMGIIIFFSVGHWFFEANNILINCGLLFVLTFWIRFSQDVVIGLLPINSLIPSFLTQFFVSILGFTLASILFSGQRNA